MYDVYNVRKNVKLENNQNILIKREGNKKKRKGESPGIAVLIEDNPGLREWWETCTGERITNNFGTFCSKTEITLLPDYSNVCERQNRLQISLRREENDSDINVDVTD